MLPLTSHILGLVPIAVVVALLATRTCTKQLQRRRRKVSSVSSHDAQAATLGDSDDSSLSCVDFSIVSSTGDGRKPQAVWRVHQLSTSSPASSLEAVATALPHRVTRLFLSFCSAFSPLTRIAAAAAADEVPLTTLNTHPLIRILPLAFASPVFLITCILSDMLLGALLPAVSFFFEAKIQHILHSALQSRTIDVDLMMAFVLTKMLVKVIDSIFRAVLFFSQTAMRRRLRGYFTAYMIKVRARLDFPTLHAEMPRLKVLEMWERQESVWRLLSATSELAATFTSLVATLFIVFRSLRDNTSFWPLLIFVLVKTGFRIAYIRSSSSGVWWAESVNEDFVRIQALQNTVHDEAYRQDVVAGNMQDAIARECDRLSNKIGHRSMFNYSYNDMDADKYSEELKDTRRIRPAILNELTPLFIAFLAIGSLDNLPSLMTASLILDRAMTRFENKFVFLRYRLRDFETRTEEVDSLWAIGRVVNKVKDGRQSFLDDSQVTAERGLRIEFRDVTFRYPSETGNTLTKVSFVIEAGQVAVFLGTNGAGKTTIFKLLARIYDPDEGTILLNGQDIRTLRLKDLREAIAVTFGNSKLLPLTIRDNIIGVHNADDAQATDDLEAVIKAADINFVHSLNDGLETYYGKDPVLPLYSRSCTQEQKKDLKPKFRGSRTLSSGEQKKILFARLLMRMRTKNSAVGLVMLDEPFTNVDAKTKKEFLDTLFAARGHKTTLFITHDLLTTMTQRADVIFVMKGGQITDRGKHDDLIKDSNGLYARLLYADNSTDDEKLSVTVEESDVKDVGTQDTIDKGPLDVDNNKALRVGADYDKETKADKPYFTGGTDDERGAGKTELSMTTTN